MSVVMNYIIACLKTLFDNGLYIKLYIGNSLPPISLYGALLFCLIFSILVMVLRKLYRW